MKNHTCSCSNDHNHSHGGDLEEFNGKKALIRVIVSGILFFISLIFYDILHNTPFSIAEYVLLLPAYLHP